jgi:hypothetical protein
MTVQELFFEFRESFFSKKAVFEPSSNFQNSLFSQGHTNTKISRGKQLNRQREVRISAGGTYLEYRENNKNTMEVKTMSGNRSNKVEVPEAKAAMDRFKTEVASELGVNLKEGYNGDLTSREAGSIGGEMVRRMIKKQEEQMK